MPSANGKRLLDGWPWFQGADRYPIEAYSEFLPPPRLGRKPYPFAAPETYPLNPDEPDVWQVSEFEEALELRPGLEHFAGRFVSLLAHLGRGEAGHGIARAKLADNPYWPPELAAAAGKLPHERYVLLLPLALSRTQDDKGRLRWTLFGGSEAGPGRAFWTGLTGPGGAEVPAAQGLGFFRQLLHAAYGEPPDADLLRAGFRLLPPDEEPACPGVEPPPLPSWAAPFVLPEKKAVTGVKYLLTFRPFGELPAAVRRAYLSGGLHLLPFP